MPGQRKTKIASSRSLIGLAQQPLRQYRRSERDGNGNQSTGEGTPAGPGEPAARPNAERRVDPLDQRDWNPRAAGGTARERPAMGDPGGPAPDGGEDVETSRCSGPRPPRELF